MNYMPEVYEFLAELRKNNNRPWFHENKERFDRLRQLFTVDIARLIEAMGEFDPSLRRLTPKDCIYRIYRDTRFSLDKTPYKTYFSAAFSLYGKQTHRACYYLHIDGGEEGGLYGGCWMPDSAMLRKLRRAIVDNIEEFEGIINEPNLKKLYPDWWGERLKTIPKGYDRDHPQAELLRLKEYGRFSPCVPQMFCHDDWPLETARRFEVIKPLVDFLNYSLDE